MKIKAAVFDIDGTLVPYGAPGPGQAAVQALRELAQSGVAVVIATGRARYTAQWGAGQRDKAGLFRGGERSGRDGRGGAACVAEPHGTRGNVRACGFLRGP